MNHGVRVAGLHHMQIISQVSRYFFFPARENYNDWKQMTPRHGTADTHRFTKDQHVFRNEFGGTE
jgi:hypothetical protein